MKRLSFSEDPVDPLDAVVHVELMEELRLCCRFIFVGTLGGISSDVALEGGVEENAFGGVLETRGPPGGLFE